MTRCLVSVPSTTARADGPYFNPMPYMALAWVVGLTVMFVVIHRKLLFPEKNTRSK